MNLVPVTGPVDYKVFTHKKLYLLDKTTEIYIQNTDSQAQSISTSSPTGVLVQCEDIEKHFNGDLTIKFLPLENGSYEFKIFSDVNKEGDFSSFSITVVDSSNLKVILEEDAATVGKNFKFRVESFILENCLLNVYIEQQNKTIKATVKNLDDSSYEVTFTPEIESVCELEIELVDTKSNETINGDSLRIDAKAHDFQLVPYPLPPFPVNDRAKFNLKTLRENVNNLKLLIISASKEIVQCDVNRLENNHFEVSFVPTLVERHNLEIYFEQTLMNKDRSLKIDIFDVSKITAKIPSKIKLGEINTFLVDTTGAGEGNLEVVIKDGFDTLKAELLKREKRKFMIGFFSEKNIIHNIHVIFNDVPIKDSPFLVLPEHEDSDHITHKSEMETDDKLVSIYDIVEGGPIEGIQCGEKMWILFDVKTPPYYDVQFKVFDENDQAIKHTRIQKEDGTWRIEFIPITPGVHFINRILYDNNKTKSLLLHRINVVNYGEQRILYGYRFYEMHESVQLVFDAVNFKVNEILPELKCPNGQNFMKFDCKYLTDYLALKIYPDTKGTYSINFLDSNNSRLPVGASPYNITINDSLNDIIKSSGVYDVTRLTIAETYLLADYDLTQFNVIVYDPFNNIIQNCFFSNLKNDLVIEFITRSEGLHRIFFYVEDRLVDDNPFLVYINGDSNARNLLPEGGFMLTTPSYQNLPTSESFNDQSSSSSDSTIFLRVLNPCVTYNGIFCCKLGEMFHFVSRDSNIQGLCVYDPLGHQIPYSLGEDNHGNVSLIIVPSVEGTHKFCGLIDGRDFEAKLFVLQRPAFVELFEMDNYNENNNIIERPFCIKLKEETLEIDAYDPIGERVDVRYDTDNLAKIVPHTTGYFKIYVSDYYGPILGSPFFVLINRIPTPSDTEKSDLSSVTSERECVESSGIRDTILNEESSFIIRHKNLELDVIIKNPTMDVIAIKKKRTSNGFLQVSYTPDIIGLFEINILKNGLEVLGSPINIYVSDPTQVKIEDMMSVSLKDEVYAFEIDASEAGEGFIRVNIKDPEKKDILPEIIQLADRKYTVQFQPHKIGVYEFSITFNKYHVDKSPFKLEVLDKPSEADLISKYLGINSFNNNKPSIADYEINNWQPKFNTTLNKIMEETIQDTENENKQCVTMPDHSDSSDSAGEILKGEGFLKNIEHLQDGSSHLLLHLHGNNSELIRSKDPKKLKGKYKYRLKKVGPMPKGSSSEEVKSPTKSNRTDNPDSSSTSKSKKQVKASSSESGSEKSDSSEELKAVQKKSKSDKKKKDHEQADKDGKVSPSMKEMASVSDRKKRFETQQSSGKSSSSSQPSEQGDSEDASKTTSSKHSKSSRHAAEDSKYPSTTDGSESKSSKETAIDKHTRASAKTSESDKSRTSSDSSEKYHTHKEPDKPQSDKSTRKSTKSTSGKNSTDRHKSSKDTKDSKSKSSKDTSDKSISSDKIKSSRDRLDSDLSQASSHSSIDTKSKSGKEPTDRLSSKSKSSKSKDGKDEHQQEKPASSSRDRSVRKSGSSVSDSDVNEGTRNSLTRVLDPNYKSTDPTKAGTKSKSTSGNKISRIVEKFNNKTSKDSSSPSTSTKLKPESKKNDDQKKSKGDKADSKATTEKSGSHSRKSPTKDKKHGSRSTSKSGSPSEGEEIIVSNENTKTKLTRDKHRKIDQTKTVVVEERYIKEPDQVVKTKKLVKYEETETEDEEVTALSIKQQKLVEKEEQEKSYIDKVMRITNENSGTNKPTSKEVIGEYRRIEPLKVRQSETDSQKLTETMKPEESIQYEYELVVEPAETQAKSQSAADGLEFRPKTSVSKDVTKVENITTKTTKKMIKERYVDVDTVIPGKIKKTSTDRTTFLSEDEEDKITETLEKIKNTDEYSYQNRKSHKALEGTAEELEDDDVVMPEQLLIRDSDEDNKLNSATDLTILQQVELQKAKKAKKSGKHGKVDDGMFYASAHETDNMDGEEATDIDRHRSTPTDNLFDYYKLSKPTEIGNEEDEEEDQRFSNKFNYTPIDLSELGHDENFRPSDKTLIVKNTLEKDSKSSLVNNESFEVVVEDDEESGPHHRSNRSETDKKARTGADRDSAKAMPFDSILAKFERKSSTDNSSTDREITTAAAKATTQRTRSEDPCQKPTPTKLPKSKFDFHSKIQEGKISPTNDEPTGSGRKPSKSSHKDKTRETDASTAGKVRESRGSDSEDRKTSKSPQRRSFSELPKSNRKYSQSSDSDGFSSQFKRPEKSSDSNSVRDLTSVFEGKKSSDSTRSSRSPPTTGGGEGSSKSRGDRSKQQEQESSNPRKSPTLNKPCKSSGGSKKIVGGGSKSPENQEAVNEMISKLREDNAAATEKIKKLNDQIYNIFDKNAPANASDESSSASSDAPSKKSHTAADFKDSAATDTSKQQPKKLDKSFLNQYETHTSSSTEKPGSGSKTSAAAGGKSPKSSVSHIPRSKNSYSSSGSDKEDPKESSSETKTKPKKLVFSGSNEADNSKSPREVGDRKRSPSTLSDATAPGSGQTIGPNKFKLQEVDIGARLREQKELADEIIKEDSRIKKLSQKFESDDSDSKPKRSFSVTKKSADVVDSSKDSGPTETISKAADKLHNRFQGIKGSSSSSSESDNEKSKLKAPSSRTKKGDDDNSSLKSDESKATKDSGNRRQLASPPTHQRHSSLLSTDREDLPSDLGQDKTRSKSSSHDVQSKVKKLSERFSNNTRSDTTGSESEQKPLDCGVPPSVALDRSTKADANKPKKLAKNKFERYEAGSSQVEPPSSPRSNRSASTPGDSQYYNKNKGTTSKAGDDSSDSRSIQDGRSRLRKVEKFPTETRSNETKVDENMTPSKLRHTFGNDADKSDKDSATAGSKSTTKTTPTTTTGQQRASKGDESTSDHSVYKGRRVYGRDGPDDIASKPRHAYGSDDMDVSPKRTNRAGKDIETPIQSPDSASKPGSSGRKTYGKDSSPFPRSKLDREDEETAPHGVTRTPSDKHADGGGSKSKGISHLLDKFESSGPNGSEVAPTSRNVSQARRSSDDKTNTTSTGKKTIDSKESAAAGVSKSGDGSKDSVDLFRDKLRNRRDPRDALDESESKTTTTDKTKARTRSNDVNNLLNEYERKIRPKNNNNANQSGETSDDSVFQKLASRSGPGKKSPTLDEFNSTRSKHSSDKTKDLQDSKSHQQQSVLRRTKSSKSRSPPTHRGEDDEGNRSSELDACVYVRKTGQPGRSSASRFRNTDDDTTDYDVPKLRKKSSYEAGEFAPVKFSDKSSIGSESRVYPRAVSQREFFEDTDTDGAVENKTRPRAKRPNSVGYRDNGIEVQLEVEYKEPLDFSVRKTNDGEPVEFKKFYNQNKDRSGVNFNYESIADFTVDVRKQMESENFRLSYSEDDESLYAEIEINVIGEYLFQIVRKKDGRSIPIKVLPKSENTYRIQFEPSATSGYVLKAKALNSSGGEQNIAIGSLSCSFNNPKKLKVHDLIATDEVLSFSVNTRNAGAGNMKCYVYYSDNTRAQQQVKQIDEFTYLYKILINREKSGTLNLFLAHESHE